MIKTRHLIMFVLFLTVLGVTTFKLSSALFASSASNSGNSFTAASSFPTTPQPPAPVPPPPPTGPQPGDVVINEIFASGSAVTEWVEIFNKTASPIDVSGWKITDNSGTDVFPNTSPIPAGGYGVIVGNTSATPVPVSATKIQLSTAIGNGLAAGDDRLILLNSGDVPIDQVSWGTDISQLNPAAAALSSSQSLARIPDGADANIATDWQVDSTPTIGVVNSL